MLTPDRVLAAEVERRIREVLAVGADNDASHVDVTIRGNRVTLSGSVRSWTEHQDAGRAAAETPGVAGVTNDLALLVRGRVDV